MMWRLRVVYVFFGRTRSSGAMKIPSITATSDECTVMMPFGDSGGAIRQTHNSSAPHTRICARGRCERSALTGGGVST